MEETLLLKKELNELTNLLQQNEKNRVMERQIFKEKEKQHIRDVEELKRQVWETLLTTLMQTLYYFMWHYDILGEPVSK